MVIPGTGSQIVWRRTMDIQKEIQQAIALLRKAEDKLIADRKNPSERNKQVIISDIWTVKKIMDDIHYELHQRNNDTIKSN